MACEGTQGPSSLYARSRAQSTVAVAAQTEALQRHAVISTERAAASPEGAPIGPGFGVARATCSPSTTESLTREIPFRIGPTVDEKGSGRPPVTVDGGLTLGPIGAASTLRIRFSMDALPDAKRALRRPRRTRRLRRGSDRSAGRGASAGPLRRARRQGDVARCS